MSKYDAFMFITLTFIAGLNIGAGTEKNIIGVDRWVWGVVTLAWVVIVYLPTAWRSLTHPS